MAVVPEQAVREVAREVCWRAELGEQGRDPLPGRALSLNDGGEAEPCSYDAEVQWIVRHYARQIEGIRQINMPRDLMEAAIRAVRDAQRAALAAMRERRRRRRKRPPEKLGR